MSAAFVAIAALLALAAASCVALPLLLRSSAFGRGDADPTAASSGTATQGAIRAPAAPVAAAVTGFALVGGAVALYAVWSSWSWPAADPAAATSPAAMVSTLARRLESEPADVAGWLLLGRSYVALGQFPLAARAYQRADRLEGGRNVEALTGWAEALALSNDAELAGRAGRLFDKALELEPNAPKALFFGAVAAQRRGDLPLALSRFETLLASSPPENVRPLIAQQVTTLKAAIAGGPAAPAPALAPDNAPPPAVATAATPPALAAGPAGTASAAGRAESKTAGAAVAMVRLRVSIAPALAGRIPASAPLFVFVRFPGQPGPPVAVQRLVATLPQTVELTPADAMMGGRGFGAGDRVEVTARIALGGQPTASSGDPVGQVGYDVGRDGEKNLVIDRLTP